jgi:Cdc6-like AAA superfamily ATPase
VVGFPYLPQLHYPRNRNYFLDGERGTGKSTVLLTVIQRVQDAWVSREVRLRRRSYLFNQSASSSSQPSVRYNCRYSMASGI